MIPTMGVIDIKPFVGQHCESTTLVNMLRQRGLKLSEPMVFGLGQGLNFIYWKTKDMAAPFIGGRSKPDGLRETLAERLDLESDVRTTQSTSRGWRNLAEGIDAGNLVGLRVDSYYLEYNEESFHFGGHYVACYGYDDRRVFLIDTMNKKASHRTSRDSLAKARSYQGPMAPKHLSFTLGAFRKKPDLRRLIPEAILANAPAILAPPIKNLGWKGMVKTGALARGWLRALPNAGESLPVIATVMEKAGTGGGLFRRIYADFLKEAAKVTGVRDYDRHARAYTRLADIWTQLAENLEKAGMDGDDGSLKRAAALFEQLGTEERSAMEGLAATAQEYCAID